MSIDLDLLLEHADAPGYQADLRVTMDSSDGPVAPLKTPAPVALDFARLEALELDPCTHGAALSAMVFADANLGREFAKARAVAAQRGAPLRLRLAISAEAEVLHALRWEVIGDPLVPDRPLTASTQVLFSRVLPCADWQPLRERLPGTLRAVALVAAPADLPDYGFAPISAAEEMALLRAYFDGCDLTLLGERQASLPALLSQLHAGTDLLFVMAHGRVDETGETLLFLDNGAGVVEPVRGQELVARIAEQIEKPRLVILGCCDSSGSGDAEVLAALGPQLVQAGVPAVLAMQGRISRETLRRFLPACLRSLQRDGRIDLAVTVARDQVRDRPDWWVPVLWMRSTDGRLWKEPQKEPDPPEGENTDISEEENTRTSQKKDPDNSGVVNSTLNAHQREELLELLKQRYQALLDNAAAYQVRLQVRLQTCPDAVDPPWRRQILRSPARPRPIPPGTTPAELFDSQNGQLLVLGAPGAGKTTLIVELAQALTQRALLNKKARIPVVLNVASWRSGQTLREWLARALRDVLGASQRFAARLAAGDDLLLLLDGLDELAAERRSGCVQAINAYLAEADLPSLPLVVGCRSQEYAEIDDALELAGAVELLPLELPAVERELADVPAASGVLAALHTDTVLRELATTPLMVNVLLLAHEGEAVPQTESQTVEERRAALWATYLRRMLIQRPLDRTWQAARVLRSLRWLAGTLRERSQTNFLIDNLQPAVLPSARQRRLYRVLGGLGVGLVLGLGAALIYGFAGSQAGGLGLTRPGVWGLGMVGGLIAVLALALLGGKEIQRTEQLRWSWAQMVKARRHALLVGLVGGLGVGLVGALSGQRQVGLVGGLCIGILGALMMGWHASDLTMRTRPMQGIFASLRTGLILAFPCGLVGLVCIGLLNGLVNGLLNGLIFGLVSGLVFGLGPVLQHYALRLVLSRTGLFPFRAITFLDGMAERLLLERDGAFFRFRHLLLRDFFADLTDAEIDHLARDL
ncbi:MAG TPA: CHAT domain-containing protein [Roseiflexaceae bacterium]|nr:CHAT domain-containing protein [Roseiflexaceae bacterium]